MATFCYWQVRVSCNLTLSISTLKIASNDRCDLGDIKNMVKESTKNQLKFQMELWRNICHLRKLGTSTKSKALRVASFVLAFPNIVVKPTISISGYWSAIKMAMLSSADKVTMRNKYLLLLFLTMSLSCNVCYTRRGPIGILKRSAATYK